MDSDDPDILSFGSEPSPEPGRQSGSGWVRRFSPARRLGSRLPAAGAAGIAIAGIAVACVALASGGTARPAGTAQPGHAPHARSVPAVTMKYQAGVSGFLRAELPAVRLSTGQTVPLRTIATTIHCRHQ